MIRVILAIAALTLVSPDAIAAKKKPKFQSAPGAESSESRVKRKGGKKFKSVPVAPATEETEVVLPKVEAGGVGPGWLPPRGDDLPAVVPGEWATLFDRCMTSVAKAEPLDATGLVTIGDDVVNYEEPYTKQNWVDANREFSVSYQIWTNTEQKPARLCKIDTVRGKENTAENARAVDDGFVAMAYDLMDRGLYVDRQHPDGRTVGELGENDTRYLIESKAGNVRGCRVRIIFTKTFFGDNAALSMSVEEAANKPCTEKSGDVGAG